MLTTCEGCMYGLFRRDTNRHRSASQSAHNGGSWRPHLCCDGCCCCLLFVVCCLLFVVCCLLFVACCLLFVVCCLLLLLLLLLQLLVRFFFFSRMKVSTRTINLNLFRGNKAFGPPSSRKARCARCNVWPHVSSEAAEPMLPEPMGTKQPGSVDTKMTKHGPMEWHGRYIAALHVFEPQPLLYTVLLYHIYCTFDGSFCAVSHDVFGGTRRAALSNVRSNASLNHVTRCSECWGLPP